MKQQNVVNVDVTRDVGIDIEVNNADPNGKTSSQFEGAEKLCLHNIFERIVDQYPRQIAVIDSSTHLTYEELNNNATRLATALIQFGIKPGELVGVCLPRCVDLVVGILGILKAGAAYVPIDSDYPLERRIYLLNSSAVKTVITNTKTNSLFAGFNTIFLDSIKSDSPQAITFSEVQVKQEDLAYVIFTSGSTGQPKGVMVEHRNVVRLFTETHNVFEFNKNDIWCNFHSVSFDFSVWEIWGALLFGAKLIMVSKEETKDPKKFYQLLVDKKVTVLNQTPSSFRNLIAMDEKMQQDLNLRYIIFGGERLDGQVLTPWIKRHGTEKPHLINMYGITETTVHVTWKKITAIQSPESFSLIGSPISDLKLDIVDEAGKSLPLGQEGIMYVGGAGLSRGYLNNVQLTNERFVYRSNSLGKLECWYNSGDIGIEIKPNEFAYIGRADSQLKIRGYRIEPSEIEGCINENVEVQDCVILDEDFGDNDKRIVAYVIPKKIDQIKNDNLISTLKESLINKLPSFMCPSCYFIVEEIPTTPHGKLDKKRLAQIRESKRALIEQTLEKSKNEFTVKEKIREIWTSLLETTDYEDNDEFFDLGGTSFSLIKMLRRTNEYYGTDFGTDVLSQGVTVSILSTEITKYLNENAIRSNV
jgi:amino acid adenylation domain-containing protein